SPRWRRNRLSRAPRKSLRWSTSVKLSNNLQKHKSSFDTAALFAATFTCPSGFPATSTNREFVMGDFGQVVAAPAGRFDGIKRPYSVEDVLKLRGSIPVEHTLARRGALKLWELLHEDEPVRALGALSGNQAMQMVRAGLQAIYLSGWQVAADSNVSGSMYPHQSLYPANSGPELARKINKTFQRADQIEHLEGGAKR